MNRTEEILNRQESIMRSQSEILDILKNRDKNDILKAIAVINERLDALEEIAGIENDHQGV